MIPLIGDVRVQREDPFEIHRRKYVRFRKLLAEKATDLEIPFEEIEELFAEARHNHHIITGEDIEHWNGGIGRTGIIRPEDAEAKGFKITNYRVFMKLQGTPGEQDTGYIMAAIEPLGRTYLSDRRSRIFRPEQEFFDKYCLVDRDLIAVIQEFCPYPFDQFTLAHEDVDTTDIDRKLIPRFLSAVHNDLGVKVVRITPTDLYEHVFVNNGFVPTYPDDTSLNYVLEDVNRL